MKKKRNGLLKTPCYILLICTIVMGLMTIVGTGGIDGGDVIIVTDNPPEIGQVSSSVFSDTDNVYPTGRVVRIDVEESSGATDIVSGTIQITSVSQGYDSGIQNLTFDPIFFNWDTTDLNPASDYVIEIILTDAAQQTATDNSLVITLAPNPPAINRLVSEVDLSFPARGIPVRVVRTYLLDSGFDGPLGFGWIHSYFMHIVETSDGIVKVFNFDGSGSFFKPTGGGTYDPPKGDFQTLTKNPDSTFQLREKFGTTFHFDAEGKLVSIEDRNKNTLSLNYNKSNLLNRITDPSGRTTTFRYDNHNRIASITDPAGRKVSYRYDSAGNLTSIKNIGGFKTKYAYDAEHNLMTITDPTGRKTFFTTNVDDQLESISREGENNSLSFQYGVPAPDQMTVIDTLGNQTIITYDNNASVTSITDPLGNTTAMVYDNDLNLIRLKDANGYKTRLTYDSQGNVLTMKDAHGNATVMTYEPLFNQVKSLTDAKGNATSFDYDFNGNLVGIKYPDGSSEAFVYDISGNLTSKTDRMNHTTNFAYNSTGRLTAKLFPDCSADSFTYDAAGNLVSATDENGTISFDYDRSDRISQVTYPGGDIIVYEYDRAGNRTQVTYPDGTVLDYDYDEVNRLTQIKTSGQMVARYTYDQSNRVIRRDLQNGTFATYSYDQSSRLIDLINRKSTSEVVSRFSYTFDNVGNRLTMTTPTGIAKYTYDKINQLKKVIFPNASKTRYEFDHMGNRIAVTSDGITTRYKTNNLNQYTDVGGDAYTYDANGNLTSKKMPAGTTKYKYDFENHLIQVDTPEETITYTYDSFGRRTSKTTSSGTTNYIHDGFQVIMEKDDSGAFQASYIYGISIDEVLVMKRNGLDYFYSHDGLGSVTDLTDFSENIVESFSYDAYGTPSNISSVGNPYLFTGREFESGTGLYYFRTRYYDPGIGRFMSVDPIGLATGNNLYIYVLNNPLNFVDPTGELWFLPPVLINVGWTVLNSVLICSTNPTCQRAVIEFLIGLYETVNEESVILPPTPISTLKEFIIMNLARKLPEMVKRMGSFIKNIRSGDPTFIQPVNSENMNYSRKSDVCGNDIVTKISVPYMNSLVRANVPIFGLACGNNFKEYRVEYGEGKEPTDWICISRSTTPQTKEVTPEDLDDSTDITIHGNLATWDTGLKNYVYHPSHPKDHPVDLKGVYTVRLVVIGKDNSTVEDRVTADVANVIPNAWGGEATSKDGRVVLSVPEQALMDSFRLISIKSAEKAPVVSTSGRQLIGNIYEFREPGEKFTKEAILEMGFLEEEIGEASLERLGIYAYNSKTKEWDHLNSQRHEGGNAVFTRIQELHRFYALMASTIPDEGSTLNQTFQKTEQHRDGSPNSSNGHYLVRNTFEDDLGEWSNRDGEVGAQVTLDDTTTFDGTQSLKITNTNAGGNFAVNVRTTPFDARDYPQIQFDYRISPEVKTNFLVKVSERWYEIGFTDDAKKLRNKRVNIANIGDIKGVVADEQWHTVQFNLYNMLRNKTGNTVVEEMIMADWDTGGYMKLQFGKNRKGATYYIDNFAISREVSPGLRMESNTILVDHFNQKKETNALGGATRVFVSSTGGQVQTDFSKKAPKMTGHALAISYDVSQAGSYAGYVTALQNLDLRGYHTLTLSLKGTDCQNLLIGVKDSSGHESKVLAGHYLPMKSTMTWQAVKIPLKAFSDIIDWGRIENLSISFENKLHDRGIVFVDNIEFCNEMKSFIVDNFERIDKRNLVGRMHKTFVSGSGAINGVYSKVSPNNGIYRLSYGGNIGDINAYASELFSYAGWTTDLGGINCSQCGTLSFRIRGAEGGEKPNIYLDDGNFRWGVDIEKYTQVTTKWQTITIPFHEFADFGVDLTHLAELQIVFEWEKMSGTIYLDDIQFGTKED